KAIRDRERELQNASEQRKAKKAIADAKRYTRAEVKDADRRRQIARYHGELKKSPEYKAYRKWYGKLYLASYRARCSANVRSYQVRKFQSLRPWNTPEIRRKIEQFYEEAQRTTIETG